MTSKHLRQIALPNKVIHGYAIHYSYDVIAPARALDISQLTRHIGSH